MARYLDLGPGDNVVTVATDGFDRYPSVLDALEERTGPIDADAFESVFRSFDRADILDVRPPSEKDRLFALKEQVWAPFGYSHACLAAMQSQSFWDAQFAAIGKVDRDLAAKRSL